MLSYQNEFRVMIVVIALAVSLAIFNLIHENEVFYSLKLAFVITVALLFAHWLESKRFWLRLYCQSVSLLLLLGLFAVTLGWTPK